MRSASQARSGGAHAARRCWPVAGSGSTGSTGMNCRTDTWQFLPPAEKLAHMNTGRSRDIGNAGPPLECRSDQPLLLFMRPALPPLHR